MMNGITSSSDPRVITRPISYGENFAEREKGEIQGLNFKCNVTMRPQ